MIPGSGEGVWFVARGVFDSGNGTYDSLAPEQSGSRDAGIEASGVSCP